MSPVILAAGFMIVGSVVLIAYYLISERNRMARRIQSQVIAQTRGGSESQASARARFLDRFDSFARALGVRVLTDNLERGRLAKLMAEAGLRRTPIEYGIAIKTIAGAVLAFAGSFVVPIVLPRMPDILATLAGIAAGALAGWRLPDLVLSQMAQWRKDRIDKGIPDALDLLVVCAEAGLALESAMDRIGAEMKNSHPQLAEELVMTSAEIRLLPERVQALENFATRTGVMSARVIATTLSQTLRYGTPLSQALRILANELRTNRLLAFEAKAGKLPVILTVPMILFILPCIFFVVGGPAFVNLFASTQ
ncbi:MAG: type II secretion system F family protein [Alphaproteobacteria bacterium]|nr:type II secretion system F family protein [Alphaproteobacteria bacterium]